MLSERLRGPIPVQRRKAASFLSPAPSLTHGGERPLTCVQVEDDGRVVQLQVLLCTQQHPALQQLVDDLRRDAQMLDLIQNRPRQDLDNRDWTVKRREA